MNYNKIKALAEEKGISIRKLCAAVGISDAGFYKMVNNKTMTISTLEKISKELGVPTSYFFFDESEIDEVKNDFQKYQDKGTDAFHTQTINDIMQVLTNALVTTLDLMRKDIERLENEVKKLKKPHDAA